MARARERLIYPRVLFLTSSAFNKVTGGGITFSNLFQDWPKDEIATIHNDRVRISREICERYFQLSTREIKKWGPLGVLDGPSGQGSTVGRTFESGKEARALGPMRRVRWIVFGDALPETARLSPGLAGWIDDFQPEVLYTILGSNSLMELCEKIRDRFKLPLAIHLMDDWPETLYQRGLLGRWQRKKMERLFTSLLRSADLRMAISRQMSEAYERRYGLSFLSFQNAVDVDRWEPFAKRDLEVGRPARLLYVGSVYPNAQLDSLIECCQAVSKLRDDGMALRLDIFSPLFLAERYRHRLEIGPGVRLNETIDDDERFFSELASADALILPVNFDDETVRYIRYSMPAKVPAYLASGTPILVYGPESVAQVQYAKEDEWGHIVSRQGVTQIAAGIRRILSDRDLRRRLSARARALARQNHDAPRVQREFQAALCRAARVN